MQLSRTQCRPQRGREGSGGYLNPGICILTDIESCSANVLEVMECRFKDYGRIKGQMSSKIPH